MTTLILVRGDTRTLYVTGLLDEDGNPTTFGADDSVRFTAKRHVWHTDAQALIVKSSDAGEITFVAGEDHADILIVPADLPTAQQADVPIVWDVQLCVAGDVTDVRTIASGTGKITADSTLTVP